MKKLLAILVVFALFASTAFADGVTIGGWGRADFIPLNVTIPDSGDSVTVSATGVSWGGWPAFGANIAGDGGQIGFLGKFKFELSDGSVGIDGQAYVWWQPLDILKLSVGAIEEDALRGWYGPESFAGKYCGAGWFGEDAVFSRFNTTSTIGAVLKLTPIEGLTVGAAILTGGGNGGDISDVFKYSQYGLGYEIGGIGFARVGYFGNNSQAIQVAFRLTAVEGVGLDFGFTYKTDSALRDAYKNTIQINLVGSIGISDSINIWFGIDGNFGGDKDKLGGDAAKLAFGVNPVFGLGDIGDVGLGFYIDFKLVDDAKANLGFDLYLAKGFGGGEVKVGVAAKIVPDSYVQIAVPISITYWF